MFTQAEQVSTSEIWADWQYHKVLNYLTGSRIFTHGSVRLMWLGAPWLALYRGLEYEKGKGPIWILHGETLTGHMYASPKNSPREMMLHFAEQWEEYADGDSLDDLPLSLHAEDGKAELKKWSAILKSMTSDPGLWPLEAVS